MTGLPLMCTVTGCGLPLGPEGRALVCPRRHSYDRARSGYVNLLQPQDRKSSHAGDSPDAVDARARLYASGVGMQLVETIVERVAAGLLRHHANVADTDVAAGGADAPEADPAPAAVPADAVGTCVTLANPVVAELGCGTGELLTALARRCAVRAIGIDLSTAAVAKAARHNPALTWVVANADRRIPLLDRSAALVLSIHARRHPAECARVLMPGGSLLVAVPAPDDLVELRERVLGQAQPRSRLDAVLIEHADRFELRETFTVRARHRLERTGLLDLLAGTYRGARSSAAEAVAELTALDVTLASDVAIFAVRPPTAP